MSSHGALQQRIQHVAEQQSEIKELRQKLLAIGGGEELVALVRAVIRYNGDYRQYFYVY
jgi:hypothetical protein